MEYISIKDGNGKEYTVEGRPIEQEDKLPPIILPQGKTLVGLSKGITINLGNYQSARIDCWITKMCNDTPEDINKNITKISKLIDVNIMQESDKLMNIED